MPDCALCLCPSISLSLRLIVASFQAEKLWAKAVALLPKLTHFVPNIHTQILNGHQPMYNQVTLSTATLLPCSTAVFGFAAECASPVTLPVCASPGTAPLLSLCLSSQAILQVFKKQFTHDTPEVIHSDTPELCTAAAHCCCALLLCTTAAHCCCPLLLCTPALLEYDFAFHALPAAAFSPAAFSPAASPTAAASLLRLPHYCVCLTEWHPKAERPGYITRRATNRCDHRPKEAQVRLNAVRLNAVRLNAPQQRTNREMGESHSFALLTLLCITHTVFSSLSRCVVLTIAHSFPHSFSLLTRVPTQRQSDSAFGIARAAVLAAENARNENQRCVRNHRSWL